VCEEVRKDQAKGVTGCEADVRFMTLDVGGYQSQIPYILEYNPH